MIRFRLLLSFIIFFSFNSYAQRYYGISKEEFGRTKAQSKAFQWKNFSSANFEYNFYKGGEQITRNAAEYLEKAYPKIIDILGYVPYETVKIFVFNSPNDINATNLSNGDLKLKNGAVIDMKNSRILTAFDKNDSLFHQQMVKNVTTVYVNEMLFGGNFRESLENQILLSLPEWFIAGITAYVAESDNSALFEDFRKAITDAQSKKLSSLREQEAALVGQSIWHYIALKYGKNNISNILNLTRVIRDEQSSITSTLGISFSRFIKEWRDFYLLGLPVVEVEPQAEKVDEGKIEIRPLELRPGEVNTDDYVFDEVNLQRFSDLATLEKKAQPSNNKSPRPDLLGTPQGKFTAIKAFQNFLILKEPKLEIVGDPVRQFGLGYSLGINDLLQNNVFEISSYIRPTTPLFKSYDLNMSYGYYAKKTNFRFTYTKRSVNMETIDARDGFLFKPLNYIVSEDRPEYLYRRLVGQTLSAAIIYPLSKTVKLEINPSVVKNDDIDFSLNRLEGIVSDFYFAPGFRLVFDNSKTNKFGIESGTKIKFSLDKYYHTSSNLKNFQNYYLDARHYQHLIKGLQLAGRLSYGSSTGRKPSYTFIGGVENSLNRATYRSDVLLTGGNPDLKNILFYNFPGNLRGFDFGRLYGNNHLLLNIELRAHLAEYLPQMALSSRFIRDFQIVGFYDMGTVWMGKTGPFSRKNSLNTTISQKGPFIIEVTNFKNPFLSGLGTGLRSTIFGVFVRADYGFGIEDKSFNGSRFYLSVGKDF